MKRKTFRKLAIIPILIILLFSLWQMTENIKLKSKFCEPGSSYAIHENFPGFFAEQVQNHRQKLFEEMSMEKLGQLEKSITPLHLDQEEDIKTAEDMIASYTSQLKEPDKISYGEAKEELDYLYRYMKYTFAGFTYYGGDEKFIPLFQKIIQEIQREGENGRITVSNYSNILKKNLFDAIGDLHCYIDHQLKRQYDPNGRIQNYYSEDYQFSNLDNEFTTCLQGQKYVLLSINGARPENYLVPTILEDGTISYIVWFSSDSVNVQGQFVTALLQNEEKRETIREIKIPLFETKPAKQNAPFTLPYYFEDLEQYSYIRNSSLQDEFRPYQEQMLKDAKELTKKPIIIDIRGHKGGDSTSVFLWIFQYLHISRLQLISVPIPNYSYELHTNTLSSMRKGKLVKDDQPGLYPRSISPFHSADGFPLHIKNTVPIFLLIDRDTGSSGEWWISYMRRFDNVVIIGENSAGVQIGGNVVGTRLLYSRISIGFSTQINFESNGTNYENIGFAPDLYVSAAVSLERTQALLKAYSIP